MAKYNGIEKTQQQKTQVQLLQTTWGYVNWLGLMILKSAKHKNQTDHKELSIQNSAMKKNTQNKIIFFNKKTTRQNRKLQLNYKIYSFLRLLLTISYKLQSTHHYLQSN
jgi:hypothetical protein